MADYTLPAGIINQKHFDRYAAKWLSVLTSRHHEKLRQSFQPNPDKGSRIPRVTFPLEHIIYLISSVGASYIQARFLLMEAQQVTDGSDAAAADQDRFTLALYATNAQGERVSAYYISNEDVSTYPVDYPDSSLPRQQASAAHSEGAAKPRNRPQEVQRESFEGTTPSNDGVQIPHLMVKDWLAYWIEAHEIMPAMFQNSYGPLQGYTFDLSDFREPLFNAQPWTLKEHHLYKRAYNMRVDFGLHKYYAAVSESCEPTLTFGLVLQLQALAPIWQEPASVEHNFNVTGSLTAVDGEDSDPFFDMSMPCPPNR
ncbi:MAG: hypothetical protein ACRYG7_06690 [Janthinobacterium lividum]